MVAVIVCFLSCFCLGALSFALHWGASSQLLVLLMGLAILPLQMLLHRGPLSDLGFRRCSWLSVGKGIVFPAAILGLIALSSLTFGFGKATPLSNIKNPFHGGAPISNLWEFANFLAIYSLILFFLEFVTEELMFRGYLMK